MADVIWHHMRRVRCGPNCFLVFVYGPLILHSFDTSLLVPISAMIQQPRVPSSGLRPASDVLIHAKEVSPIYLRHSEFYLLGMAKFGCVCVCLFFLLMLFVYLAIGNVILPDYIHGIIFLINKSFMFIRCLCSSFHLHSNIISWCDSLVHLSIFSFFSNYPNLISIIIC